MAESTSLWVFGYGSLVWKPGFKPGCTLVGSVEGFARRFWQGNETHRGVPGKPGRVATLVEEKGVVTHGVALELTGEEALDYLNNREMTLGGYSQKITMFRPEPEGCCPAFPVLVFVATSVSKFWLGPAAPEAIAEQVVNSSGPSGHNVEYVLKLAEWLHKTLPDVYDDHLYSVEFQVRLQVAQKQLCLKTLMGEVDVVGAAEVEQGGAQADPEVSPHTARRGTFQYTCENKCLKCVKL